MPQTSKKEKARDRELIDEVKLVADYTGLSITASLELPCDLFALSLKKAFIERLSKTEEGRKMLETAEQIKETECDFSGFEEYIEEVED